MQKHLTSRYTHTHINLKLYLHDKGSEFVYLTGAVILSTRQNKYVFRVWGGGGDIITYTSKLSELATMSVVTS